MKTWVKAEVEELVIEATALTPTTEFEFDDYNPADQTLRKGGNSGSSTGTTVTYYPN